MLIQRGQDGDDSMAILEAGWLQHLGTEHIRPIG